MHLARSLACVALMCMGSTSSTAAVNWCPSASTAGGAVRQVLLQQANRHLSDAPRPQPTVSTAGRLPGDATREQSLIARRDLPLMRSFALAWKLSGDPRYAQGLSRFLDAWTRVYRISFNPIDETHFEAVADAYAIAGDALPESTRQATAAFLRAMASGYIERMDRGRTERKDSWSNNWQSHRVKIVTLAAVALEDGGLFAQARRLFLEQLAANIRLDGSVEDFHQRDALHYVTYDLEPLVRAALAARLRGEEWLTLTSSSGSSLSQALNWLLPYARGAKQHQEFVRSRVRFDAERRAAGVKGFGGLWQRSTASELFWTAALLDSRYTDVARSLSDAPPVWMQVCHPLPTGNLSSP